MTKEEEEQLTSLIASNPGLAVTPQILLQFIAMRTTTAAPRHSPDDSPTEDDASPTTPSPDASDDDYYNRQNRRASYSRSHSRSSSRDSTGTSVYRPPSRPPSRGPSVPPKTPTSADSPFDHSRRQRTTPLETSAPSSWSRRPPPSRRKSDAGPSDSEVSITSSILPRLHGCWSILHARRVRVECRGASLFVLLATSTFIAGLLVFASSNSSAAITVSAYMFSSQMIKNSCIDSLLFEYSPEHLQFPSAAPLARVPERPPTQAALAQTTAA